MELQRGDEVQHNASYTNQRSKDEDQEIWSIKSVI